MSSASTRFLNSFEKTEISKFMIYYHSFFNWIFPVYNEMLKHYYYSFHKELFFLILEYLNLLIFLFNREVSHIILLPQFFSFLQFGIPKKWMNYII